MESQQGSRSAVGACGRVWQGTTTPTSPPPRFTFEPPPGARETRGAGHPVVQPFHWPVRYRRPHGLPSRARLPQPLVCTTRLPPHRRRQRGQRGAHLRIDWIIDRYYIKTDKDSGIVNDPNQWGIERGEPRYIVDPIKRVVTVSVRTVEIGAGLPSLEETIARLGVEAGA